MIVWVWLILLVYLFTWVYCAKLMADTAVMKGYNAADMHLWAICFWLGIFGYLYVLSLPDKIVQEQNQQIIKLLEEKLSNKIEEYDLPEL